jgi:hypothetical protein
MGPFLKMLQCSNYGSQAVGSGGVKPNSASLVVMSYSVGVRNCLRQHSPETDLFYQER